MKNVKKFDIESQSIIIESLDQSAIKKAHIIASQKDADKESCPVDQRSAIAQHRILLFSSSPITNYILTPSRPAHSAAAGMPPLLGTRKD